MANGVVGFCLERRKGISIRKARYRASEYRCRNHDTDVPRYLGESRGVKLIKVMHIKSEIAQQNLSDLGRRSLAL